MDNFLLSQVFVGIAFVFDFLSFQFKHRKKILICLLISLTFIISHYFLLNKQIAGFLTIISFARFTTAYFYQSKSLMALFLLLATAVTIYFYQSPIDILVYSGMIFVTISSFQKNDKWLRLIMMPGTIFFILYNFFIHSPVAIILELFFLLSNFIGYYRHYLRK